MNKAHAASYRRASFWGLCVVMLAVAGAPRAQVSPLSSVAQPGFGAADGAEPWSVVLNPAALTEARDWLFGLRHTEVDVTAGAAFLGRGSGLYVARPAPYLSRFAIGGGLEFLRPGGGLLPDLAGKLTLALGYRLLPQLAIGLGYAHLFAANTPAGYDGMNTLSLGARFTGGRFFAAGLMLHDLPAPRPSGPSGLGVERSYELELLTRPLGDHRVELAAGLRLGETTHDLWPRLRLWARPWRGISVGVDTSLALRENQGLDYRISMGLELNFAHIGASGFVLFGNRGAGGAKPAAALHGGSAALRISFERYEALWSGPRHLYKIELSHQSTSGEPLLHLLAALRALEDDSQASGILVIANGLAGGWGVADELRAAFLRLRAVHKHVVFYGADLSQREFYIATAAERLYLDPIGAVRLGGIAHSGYFVKDALEGLGIRADLIRVGDYKASPEMWTRSQPSEPARAQRQALIDDLYDRLIAAVASGRRLSPAQVEKLVEHGLYTARAAVDARLIDGIAAGTELEEHLQNLLGGAISLAGLDARPAHPRSYAPPGIAVLQIDGDLVEGQSRKLPLGDLKFAGGQTLLAALSDIERDPRIRAVVLRVSSPGGSAFTSDLLARQVAALARQKPVLCSFGDVAASGGYYLSAPCSQIFASPSTLTGSIGIFGGKVDASGLLNWLGVRRVTLQRGSHADLESPFRPYTDAERALVLEHLRQGYDRFVETVMQGRSFSRSDAEARAQGRVFSGAQAKALRLVDRIGGFMDAVVEARHRAELPAQPEKSPIYYYPQKAPSLLSQLLGLAPDLVRSPVDASSSAADWSQLLRMASKALPGLPFALLLLESDSLMRLEGELPD